MILRFLIHIIFLILFLAVTFIIIFHLISFRICPLCPIALSSAISLQNSLPGESTSYLKINYYMLTFSNKEHYISDNINIHSPVLSAIEGLGIAIAIYLPKVAGAAIATGHPEIVVITAIIGAVLVSISEFLSKKIILYNGKEVNSICKLEIIPVGEFFYLGNVKVVGKTCFDKGDFIICSNIKDVKWLGCEPHYILLTSEWNVKVKKDLSGKITVNISRGNR